MTDEHARVLRGDGSPIEGLCHREHERLGDGRHLSRPGSTLGPAMTFGYVAAMHALGRAS